MVDIENLTHRIGSRILFENATLHLPQCGKIGLVGPNGCGKTTLFRIILGQEEIDGGEIYIKNTAKLVCVKQEIEDVEISPLDLVMEADVELIGLRKIMNSESHATAEELANAWDRYGAIGGYSAEARAAGILAGLGFKQSDMRKKIGELSGGWQVRASLAATLFAPSDCLLLDEPTNHLDFETAMWLENYLEKTDKMILMISHERQFLNKICNHIVAIHGRQLQLFKGNYDTYVDTRDKREIALTRNIENLQKKRDHMQSFIDRFGAKATKARQAQSMAKMIKKMEIPEMPESAYSVKLSFPQPKPQVDRKLITLEDVSAGYGRKVVLSAVDLCVSYGDRIALLGANGNGKSTLAKVLAGRLLPISGDVIRGRSVKISYFSQQQADELDVAKTPVATLRGTVREFSETQARAHLARFGITQARAETPIGNLSGGEKSRVLLSINSLSSPHAMILDEPTNHLDIEARGALVDAIGQYEGAVILITHDFYALAKICSKFFIVAEEKCTPFNGSIDYYRKSLLTEDGERIAESANGRKNIESGAQSDTQRRRRELAALERKISAAESKKRKLESLLCRSNEAEAHDSYAACCKELSELEDKWLKLSA